MSEALFGFGTSHNTLDDPFFAVLTALKNGIRLIDTGQKKSFLSFSKKIFSELFMQQQGMVPKVQLGKLSRRAVFQERV